MYSVIRSEECLEHHGIKGMHWGVRRYQNSDGSLTSAGREHYGVSKKQANKLVKSINKSTKKYGKIVDQKIGFRGGVNVSTAAEETKKQLRKKLNYDFSDANKKLNELRDYQSKNRDKLIELEDKYMKEAENKFDKENKGKDLDDYEWEEKWMDAMDSAEKKYRESDLGKKEYKLLNEHQQELKKMAEKVVGDYGNIPFKNVYTFKNGERELATLYDIVYEDIRNVSIEQLFSDDKEKKS